MGFMVVVACYRMMAYLIGFRRREDLCSAK